MTENKESIIDPNFRNMAEEALDLWQNYLDSFASDPKAKVEMAQTFGTMGKFMEPWTQMMQQGMKAAAANPPFGKTNDVSSGATPADTATLERRVAELESRLSKLESGLAAVLAAATAKVRAKAPGT